MHCCYIAKMLTKTLSYSRKQQRPQGGGGGGKNQPQQTQQSPSHQRDQTQQLSPNQQELNSTELGDNKNHNAGRPSRLNHGGHGQRQGGPPHHGYSQNRRWHHNQKGQGHGQTNTTSDKDVPPKTTKDNETEGVKVGDEQIRPSPECNNKNPKTDSAPSTNAPPDLRVNEEPPNPPESGGKLQAELPKINLLQSSKERLRRRLKDKVPKAASVLRQPD